MPKFTCFTRLFFTLMIAWFYATAYGDQGRRPPTNSSGQRQNSYRHFRPKPKPIPPPVQFDFKNTPADSYVKKMFFSLPVKGHDSRLVGDSDLYQVEVDDISNVASGKYGDPKEINIAYDRYEFTMRAAKALVAAKEAGVAKIQVATHLANALKYPDKTWGLVGNFSKLDYADNEKGEALKYLIDHGFKYNDPQYGVFGPPFHPNSPLMHEKSLIIYKGKLPQTPASALQDPALISNWLQQNLPKNDVQIISLWVGTNNHTESYRVNRLVLSDNQIAGRYLLWHLQNELNTYRQGLPTHRMPMEPPLQINFANGDFVWIAGTDGARDLNQIRRQILSTTFNDSGPRTHELNYNLGSESVDTDFRTYEVEEKALLANPQAIDERVQDQAFARNGNFSVFDGRLGILVLRPFDDEEGGHNTVEPFDPRVRAQERTWVWQRLAPGQILKKRDGNPIGVWLYHDKTEITERTELTPSGGLGRKTSDITWGSENGSGNFPSAELRLWFHVDASSPINQMFKDSILTPMQIIPQYYVSGEDGLLRDELALLVGHALYEIPLNSDSQDPSKRLPTLEEIRDALKAGRYQDVKSMLGKIAATPTMFVDKVSADVVAQRLDAFTRGLEWYKNLPAEKKSRYEQDGLMPLTKVIELAQVLNTRLYSGQTMAKLDNILYSRGVKASGELASMVDQYADVLGLQKQEGDEPPPPDAPKPLGIRMMSSSKVKIIPRPGPRDCASLLARL